MHNGGVFLVRPENICHGAPAATPSPISIVPASSRSLVEASLLVAVCQLFHVIENLVGQIFSSGAR